MSSNFDRCNKLGKKYERLSTQIFENKRFIIAEGNHPDWDVKLINESSETPGMEEEVTLECKADTYAVRTKALAIEFEYDDRPSGIQTTKADYWVHYIHSTNRYYLIPTEFLRQVIQDGKYSRKVRGGDDYKSYLYIVDEIHFADFLDTYTGVTV